MDPVFSRHDPPKLFHSYEGQILVVQPGVDCGIHPFFLKTFSLARRIKEKTIWASTLLAFAPSHVVTLDILQVFPGIISALMEKQQGLVVGRLVSLSSFSSRSWI